MNMPTPNYALAIRNWRAAIEMQDGGLSAVQSAATVSTMLFACYRWSGTAAVAAPDDEVAAITDITQELEAWMAARSLTYNG